MTSIASPLVVAIVCSLSAAVSGCGSESSTTAAKVVMADDIPVAHTPPGGFGDTLPKPVLATCTEPLVEGAPDLRGLWKTLRAERAGKPVPADDRFYSYVERIEQCGNRIVDMGGGTQRRFHRCKQRRAKPAAEDPPRVWNRTRPDGI